MTGVSWVLFDRTCSQELSDDDGEYLPPIRVSFSTALMLRYPLLYERILRLVHQELDCGCVGCRWGNHLLLREPACTRHQLFPVSPVLRPESSKNPVED